MFVSDALNINEKNHLTVGGCDAVDLAQRYKTPLYVIDETAVRRHCRVYKGSIDRFYDGKGFVFFASKALCNLEIMRIVNSEGLGADVVSGGELYTALKAGMPPEKLCFHGNNKTLDELNYAIDSGVGRIAVDNAAELDAINRLCGEKGKRQKVLFRIKPGIDAHTHSYIMTGRIDSKFGFALETGEAHDIILRALSMENVEVGGAHCHIGSQIHELEPFKQAARVLADFIADIKVETGFEMKELDLGGGYGVMYTEEDDPIEFDKYIEAVSETLRGVCEERGIALPYIMMEPGRSVVGTAGITLYTVGGVKDIPNVRRYVSVDGGMCDNPRYILYQSKYKALLANKAGDAPTEPVTIAGKCCESGDLLGEGILLPPVETGDTLAVLTTGAYNYSMASNYNRIPRPAMVMTNEGSSRLIVRRESYEDLVKNDI